MVRGHVGLGVGKANEVPEAINKANAAARKNLIKVPIAGATIPHRILVKYGAAEILLKPASPGTGIIAGGSARPVLEAAGIKDIIAKSLGRSNRYNLAKATLLALSQLKDPKAEVARRKQVLKRLRNLPRERRQRLVAKLSVTWIKSGIGYSDVQKRTLKALGFHRLSQSVIREDSLQFGE